MNATENITTGYDEMFREDDRESQMPIPFSVTQIFIWCALLDLILMWIVQEYTEEYSDVLGVADDGSTEIVTQLCGGKDVFSVFDFDLCRYLMKNSATQKRVVPPVLFANLFRRPHGTGICTSSGKKRRLLKRMMHGMLKETKSVMIINMCASQTMQLMARKVGKEKMSITLTLVESWVSTIFMPILFDVNFCNVKIWETDMRELEKALDGLFEVREELGKLVYDMNSWNNLRFVHHSKLLYKYHFARETVAKMLKEGKHFKLRSYTDLGYTREDFTNEDILETYIEALLYCKKKLGYAVYKGISQMAAQAQWRVNIRRFIDQPVNETSFFRYIDDTTEENRRMLALIFDVLRISEQRLCCHLRKTTKDLTVTAGSSLVKIPKGSVCHIANWSDKKSLKETRYLFSTASWYEKNNLEHSFQQNFYEKMVPFGRGIRECPARNFSCQVIFCLMAHVLRTGDVRLGEASSGQRTDDIIYTPKRFFSVGDNSDYMNYIGNFWVKGKLP